MDLLHYVLNPSKPGDNYMSHVLLTVSKSSFFIYMFNMFFGVNGNCLLKQC